ncbi:MAG: DUF3820 family protein [Planctomycetes bacterium]|nr:DUF3820 family protein [Planctomycetota bacterium]
MNPIDVNEAEAAGDDPLEILEAIGRAHMPFGRFGPEHFPPRGIPIIDLPFEYLEWFERQGWPSGRFGRLLAFVYHTKLACADEVFDVFRARRGGRASLRQNRPLPRIVHDD